MAINTIHVAGISGYNSCENTVALTHDTDQKTVTIDSTAIPTAKLKLLFDYLVEEERDLHG